MPTALLSFRRRLRSFLKIMEQKDMIVVTGAAGFIGSCMVAELNRDGFEQLVLVDHFSDERKLENLRGKKFSNKVHRDQFFDWLKKHRGAVKYIFHLGARTDTTELDYEVHRKWNLEYSKQLWEICTDQQIPLVYASSAATYGDGALGYKDDNELPEKLMPLNPYGVSKNEFDIWALQQKRQPPFWAGVKFFNVYGPNEYHKGRMASVIFHAFDQIRRDGTVKLFRSHNPAYKDGEQLRDFIFVADIIAICTWLMNNRPANGLYNAGTGKARSFNDLVKAVFSALELPPQISYIDTPEDIRDKYQYFTEAVMDKLKQAGFTAPFLSLEAGVSIYVKEYLKDHRYR